MSEKQKKHAEEECNDGLLDGGAVSRRDFLKIAGVAGATIGLGAGLGGLVAACGGAEESSTTTGARSLATWRKRWPRTERAAAASCSRTT